MNTSSSVSSVFVSYNSQDRTVVEDVAHRLTHAGVQLWMDVEQLLPGDVWQRILEQEIARSRIALVFLGPYGLGRWQQFEIDAILNQHANGQCTVIPVLLKGGEVPLFLSRFTRVNFTKVVSDPINLLLASIQNCTGTPINEEAPVARTSVEWALVVGIILAVAGVSQWSPTQFVDEQSTGATNAEAADSADPLPGQHPTGPLSDDIAHDVAETIVRQDSDLPQMPPRLLPESPKWSGLAAVTHTAPDAAAVIERAIQVIESLPHTAGPRLAPADRVW